MERHSRQEEYPADKRPIVLGADSYHEAELNPVVMNPGPRIKQVANQLEEVDTFELKTTSELTDAQSQMCCIIQYAVYWIAEQHRENENEYVCLHLQGSAFQEYKNLWEQWISAELDFCQFSGRLQLKLQQVCEDEYFNVFEELKDWASLPEKLNKEFVSKSLQIEKQLSEGFQFTLPPPSELLDVDFICGYAAEAVSVLSHVTDSRDAAESIAQAFKTDAAGFRSMFYQGTIDKNTFDLWISTRFIGSCPAASSICILSEAEKQAAITVFELRLATCVPVDWTAELVEKVGNCSFCLEEIVLGQDCLNTHCLHTFHTTCLRSILFHHGHCPNCRRYLLEAHA